MRGAVRKRCVAPWKVCTPRLGLAWRGANAEPATMWCMSWTGWLAWRSPFGRTLLVAGNAALPQHVPAGSGAPAANVAYAAGYRTAAELPNYTRIMRLIEAPQASNGDPNEPPFFSGIWRAWRARCSGRSPWRSPWPTMAGR